LAVEEILLTDQFQEMRRSGKPESMEWKNLKDIKKTMQNAAETLIMTSVINRRGKYPSVKRKDILLFGKSGKKFFF
jgi:hypothetical protein